MAVSGKSRSNLRSLGLFLITIVLAVVQKWTAADVAWSMWVASLIGGYTIIFAGIASMGGDFSQMRDDMNIVFAVLLLIVFGGFITGFILLHFTAFHLGHAVFMSSLMPMSQIEGDMTALELSPILSYLKQLFAIYWPFAILVIIHTVFQIRENPKKLNMATPYIGVVKNHIMIFIVAILSQTKAPTTIMYVLLFYYFFPVKESFGLLKVGVLKVLGRA